MDQKKDKKWVVGIGGEGGGRETEEDQSSSPWLRPWLTPDLQTGNGLASAEQREAFHLEHSALTNTHTLTFTLHMYS